MSLPRTLRELSADIPGVRLSGDPATVVSDITYDSRAVTPGALFVALVGGDVDGHDYAARAVEAGAAALLVERELPLRVPQIVVTGSSRAALAPVARTFHGDPSRQLAVVGITGTDGKTTTAAMLEAILRANGLRTGGIGTVGVRIGDGTTYDLGHQTTPESLHIQRYLRQMVDAGTTHVVVEATSHGLATHRLDGVRFAHGGVTNITHEHLEYHGTVERYRRAKATLLERVREAGGHVVLNADDPGAMAIRPFAADAPVTTCSLGDAEADLRAENVRAGASGSQFDLVTGIERIPVTLPMPGRFNVANALCALGLARACGVPLRHGARALAGMASVPGRMQPIDAGQTFTVIVDYAHTPESLRSILSMLRSQEGVGRLIVVTGSAGERDVEKRPLQGAVCAEIADVTVVTSEDPRHEDPDDIIAQILAGAVGAGAVPGESVVGITDRREAIATAFDLARPGDCVLLAGKGHETSIIWGTEHRPWNEAAVAEELLRERFEEPHAARREAPGM